jgi:phosphatidylglycerophosphatase A
MGIPPVTGAAAQPPPQKTFVDTLAAAVATAGGAGYFPVAPGTVGSAVGLILFYGVHRLPIAFQLAAVVFVSLIGVAAGTRVAQRSGIEDPGIVVIDEVAGMWVSLLFLPLTPVTAVAGFFLFRVLDVVKPAPCRQLEHLPGGWGIMCDDLMAGVYANVLLRIGLTVFA